jgi:hypothetical protein
MPCSPSLSLFLARYECSSGVLVWFPLPLLSYDRRPASIVLGLGHGGARVFSRRRAEKSRDSRFFAGFFFLPGNAKSPLWSLFGGVSRTPICQCRLSLALLSAWSKSCPEGRDRNETFSTKYRIRDSTLGWQRIWPFCTTTSCQRKEQKFENHSSYSYIQGSNWVNHETETRMQNEESCIRMVYISYSSVILGIQQMQNIPTKLDLVSAVYLCLTQSGESNLEVPIYISGCYRHACAIITNDVTNLYAHTRNNKSVSYQLLYIFFRDGWCISGYPPTGWLIVRW